MKVVLFLVLLSLAFGQFSWDVCGGTEMTISSIKVTPDPIILPGNITIFASAATTIPLSTATFPLVALTLEKKKNLASGLRSLVWIMWALVITTILVPLLPNFKLLFVLSYSPLDFPVNVLLL